LRTPHPQNVVALRPALESGVLADNSVGLSRERERPLRVDLGIRSPIATAPAPHSREVNRRDLLGGLIHEYELAAA